MSYLIYADSHFNCKSNMLNAEELRNFRQKALTAGGSLLYRGGPKFSIPDSSESPRNERIQTELARDELYNAVDTRRIQKQTELLRAVYEPTSSEISLVKQTGRFPQHMGYTDKGKRLLYVEEATFLMDAGSLEVICNGSPISLQQMFYMLESNGIPFANYLVYAELTRAGLVVVRHLGPPKSAQKAIESLPEAIPKEPTPEAKQFSNLFNDCAKFFQCVDSVLSGQISIQDVISAGSAAEEAANEKWHQMDPEKIKEIWPKTSPSSRSHDVWPPDRLSAIPNDDGGHLTMITCFDAALYPPGILPQERMDDSRVYSTHRSRRRASKKWEEFHVPQKIRKTFEPGRISWTMAAEDREEIIPMMETAKRQLEPVYDVFTEKAGFAISLRDLMAPDHRLLIMSVEEQPPNPEEIIEIRLRYGDSVPIHTAVVDHGSISIYDFQPVEIPKI